MNALVQWPTYVYTAAHTKTGSTDTVNIKTLLRLVVRLVRFDLTPLTLLTILNTQIYIVVKSLYTTFHQLWLMKL